MDNIPVIERQHPVGDIIRYRGREYGKSAPRKGLEYQPYSEFKTALMYARNWRKGGSRSTHISIIVKVISKGKVIGYFVCVTPRKWVRRLN